MSGDLIEVPRSFLRNVATATHSGLEDMRVAQGILAVDAMKTAEPWSLHRDSKGIAPRNITDVVLAFEPSHDEPRVAIRTTSLASGDGVRSGASLTACQADALAAKLQEFAITLREAKK